jgi:hypothetical protein
MATLQVNFRRARKLPIYMISVFLFAAVTAHSASAWTWKYRNQVYDGPGLCVLGDAGIDHLVPNSFSGNLAYAETYAVSQGCGPIGLSLPYPDAAARLDVWKWTGSTWAVCNGTEWLFGATGNSSSEVGGPWGPQQIFNYGGPICGSGWYGTLAWAYVRDANGVWRGGGTWSGYEFVP